MGNVWMGGGQYFFQDPQRFSPNTSYLYFLATMMSEWLLEGQHTILYFCSDLL
jgi:hypothetical protein